jgi:hypothetical protein
MSLLGSSSFIIQAQRQPIEHLDGLRLADAVCVDPARIEEFWPWFRPMIKMAIDEVGLTNFEDVERDILSGYSLLWLAYEEPNVLAAASTSLVDGVLEITACGGENLPKFLHLLGDLEQYGRDEGCKASRIIGRKGWIKVLKNYKQKAVVLERAL